MNHEIEEMKIHKKVRQKKITDIVQNYTVATQDEIVKILKRDYKIDAKQSTVSRDMRELQITRDPKKNKYVLGSKVIRNKEASKLARLMQQADVLNIEGELCSILLKGKAEYMPLIATQIEDLFAMDDIFVSSFVGHNGSLLLYFPKKQKTAVERILNQIFSHIAK